MKAKMVSVVTLSLAVLLMTSMGSFAVAAKYPDKPIEFIIPWSPAGTQTLAARVLGPHAEKVLGQPIPIINIPGAGGSLGLVEFMRRPADGYSITTLITDNVLSSLLGLYKYSVYEMDPIVRLQVEDLLIFVRKDSPFKTFTDVADFAKKNPDKLKNGTVGMSGVEAFGVIKLSRLGVKTKLVSYDGTSELNAALLRGEVDLMIMAASSAEAMVTSGQMRILALANDKRLPVYGNTPTLKELGYDVVIRFFRGIGIKKGTDPSIRKILEAAYTKAAHTEEWKKFMIEKKLDPDQGFMNSQDFAKFINDDYNLMEKMVKETGYLGK